MRLTEPFTLAEGEARDLGTIRLEAGGGVRGRVTDDRGVPVENAGISLKDASGRAVFLLSLSSTGSDGQYALQGVELGTYTIHFDARGYAPVDKPVRVEAGGATADAVLPRGGALAVVAVDEADKPVEGAHVEIYDGAGQKVTKTLTIANVFDSDVSRTGAAGLATIPDLVPGTYTVRATKDGMALRGDPPSASVAPGGSTTVRLVLRAGP